MSQQEKTAEIISLNAPRAPGRQSPAMGGESAGEFLGASRVAAGLSLDEVSEATKIKKDHLEAIESADAKRLPATPYAVGFVKVYAAYLGLDVVEVARRFREEIAASAPAEEPSKAHAAEISSSGANDGVRLVSLMGIGAILLFVAWIALQIAGNAQRTEQRAAVAEKPATVRMSGEAAPAPRPRATVPAETVSITDGADAEDRLAAPFGEETANVAEAENAAALAAADEPAQEENSAAMESVEAVAADDAAGESTAPLLAHLAPAETESALSETPGDDIAPETQAPSPLPAEIVTAEPEATVVEAQLTRSIAPVYPSDCDGSAASFENVTIMFDVAVSGATANARVVESTNPCFEAAALTAVSRWRFSPKTVDGAPRLDPAKKATLNFQR